MTNPFTYVYYLILGLFKCVNAQYKYMSEKDTLPTKMIGNRLVICGDCPINRNGVCGDGIEEGCGCILTEKAKMSTESCPLDKWEGM
jgi:hypothetical protein